MHERLNGTGIADTATARSSPQPVRAPRADDGQQGPQAADHSFGNIPVFGDVQAKLAVGAPNDEHEQEADRVADAVMRLPAPGTRAAPDGGDEGGTKNEAEAVEGGLDSPQGSGQPLPDGERAFFEPRLGHDFSRVRVHHDARAAQSARSIDALAYTAGRDVVFGEGQYAPGTTAGRRLLAHELAHVLQQSRGEVTAGCAGTVQRKPDEPRASRLPPQPTREGARAEYYTVDPDVVPVHYLLAHDIQWYVAKPVLSTRGFVEGYDLVFYGAQEERKEFSSMEVAEAAVEVLAQAVGLPRRGHELAQHIAKKIDESGGKDAPFLMVGVPLSLVRQQFVEQAFDVYLADVQKEYPGMKVWGLMVAGGDFGAGKGAAEGTEGKVGGAEGAEQAKEERPAWVDQRKKEITALIDEARKQTPRPKDLPDRVVLWFNDRDSSWYFNVWVYLDTQGKEKRAYPVRLKQGETSEDLLARLRDATQQALQTGEDRERRELAKLAPAWAIKLERELRQRLAVLRAKEKSARDIPDGMVLVPEPEVQIQIWVERGDGPGVQRNTGSVPLKPDTTVDELVPYVRHMTAVLREYEQVPPAPESTAEEDLDPKKFGPAAFPAEIIPADLRGDNITVSGANNEFVMSLNFEAVYGAAGNMTDLYIASKLHQQYIHFYWSVHPVPAGVPLPEGQKKEPESWHRRWQWLYDTYNPPPDKEGKPQKRKVAAPSNPVTKTDGSDLRSRVRMPPEAGDYLLRCVTAHAPIGESQLQRRPSEAYYPVRVRPIEEVAKGAASLRTGAAALMEGELKGIDEQLADPDLAPNMRKMLEATKPIKTADLERLQRKETQTLGQNTAEEIAYATEVLAKTKRLRERLPGVLAQAKEQGVPPSDLLKDSAELLALWWYLIHERKTPEGYEQELEEKIKQLQGVQKRAAEFSSELKASSRYQYGPEAAFVSEVTGQVYPLVLMIGEAPDSVKAAIIAARRGAAAGDLSAGVAYSVVDVTSKQTQKAYYGYSSKSGAAAHREAIDDAFKHFGEDATYGEGLIAVRIPSGAAGAKDENHPGAEIKTYRSKEGILQKVLFALGIIAAVAGVAALVATGVGAPAAAGILGALAATAGAVTALHNIGERQRRHTLEFDAELVLDIISIVGVVPAVAGARGAISAGRVAVVGKRFLEIYAMTEVGATVILVPTKLYQDIERIELDPDLTNDQKLKMIAQAKLGAAQAALMLLGSAAASRAGARHQRGGGFVDEHSSGLRQQIELLELEGFGQYKSLQDDGYIDANGKWTNKALELMGAKAPAAETPQGEPRRLPGGEETPPAKQPAEKVEVPEARKVEEPVEAPTPKEEPEAPKPKEELEAPRPTEEAEAPKPTGETEAPAESPAQQKSAKEAARDEVRRQLAELEHKKLAATAQYEKLNDEISALKRKLAELKEQILRQSRGSKERADALEQYNATKERIEGLEDERLGYVEERIKYTQQHEALQEALKLERPGLRQATIDAIQAAAKKTPDGKFIDPNSGKVIEGEFVYGHKYGKEHRRLALEAVQKKMTQAEFNDWVNSHPEWFQIESPESNLSHKYEKPGLD